MTRTTLLQDDSSLVSRALRGDAAAFAGLIDVHAPRLKRLLRAILGTRPEADDLFQETVLRAYLNLEKLRDPSRFGAWMYSIAVNLARTERSSGCPVVIWDGNERDETQISPEARLIQQETTSRIRRAVADLPEAEREAVVLVYLEEMSHQEAARQLGASLSAVKVRVHRGRNRLRQVLMTEFGPLPGHKRKEIPMFKVIVHDIVTTPQEKASPSPEGQEKKKVFGRAGNYNVVLLREENGVRALPIWIGPFEADAIAIHLRQENEIYHHRPLTFDLMKTLLALGQVQVERAAIHRLHEEVFYANLVVHAGGEEAEIDCRPSDALNLAVRLGIPVYVAPEIMEAQGRIPDDAGQYVIDLKMPEEIEWKSLLSEEG